ncbi:MAG TPA: folylpolyglutamate synthase/dihydrofolate synthase family protein [bacterium]|nr:folylpolyglutamate synthase/dihydrofolate synthase family protein [bacterium]
MTYAQALEYLDGLIRAPDQARRPYHELKVSRMRALLDRLRAPEAGLRSVLVAGTKGKGSTVVMLAGILRAAGLRVGLTVKPHLVDYRERIQIDGRLITRAALTRLVDEVRPAVEAGRADPWGPPTYVETTVAMALLAFRRARVDVAVIEVGIGGRLDATNTADPVVSVITPVSYDHTELLGHTLTEIAREKAGIVRPGRPVVSAPQPAEAEAVIDAAARNAGSPLILVGRDVLCDVVSSTLDGVVARIQGRRGAYDVEIPLLGRHQAVNAATAVAAAEALVPSGHPWSAPQAQGPPAASQPPAGEMGSRPGPAADAVRAGIAGVRWPARVELMARRPYTIIDVGHNPASMAALCATLQELLGGRRLVVAFGMLATKDYKAVTALLAPLAAAVVTTTPDNPHALPAADLAAEVRRYMPHVEAVDDRRAAVARARRLAGPDDVLVVTGSFYFVGEARGWLLQRRAFEPART